MVKHLQPQKIDVALGEVGVSTIIRISTGNAWRSAADHRFARPATANVDRAGPKLYVTSLSAPGRRTGRARHPDRSSRSIAPYAFDAGQGIDRLQGPSVAHWFGYDNLGRDMFSRVVWGRRISGRRWLWSGVRWHWHSRHSRVCHPVTGWAIPTLILQRFIDIWIAFLVLALLITIVGIFTTRNTDSIASIAIVAITLGVLVAAGSSRVVRSAVIGHPKCAVHRSGPLHRVHWIAHHGPSRPPQRVVPILIPGDNAVGWRDTGRNQRSVFWALASSRRCPPGAACSAATAASIS